MLQKIKDILQESEEIVDIMESFSKLENADQIDYHIILDELTRDNNPFITEYILACTWMGHFERGEFYIGGF